MGSAKLLILLGDREVVFPGWWWAAFQDFCGLFQKVVDFASVLWCWRDLGRYYAFA